jgi:glycosyltransferase involved in cell wall biosynthesis
LEPRRRHGNLSPRGKQFLDLPRPIWLYFGRIAVEKGVEDFLQLQLPGSKLVVGDGPATALLKQRFPQAHYAGYRYGEELARYVSCADVFVFPSRTDTFGLVLLEAMACGVPSPRTRSPGRATSCSTA